MTALPYLRVFLICTLVYWFLWPLISSTHYKIIRNSLKLYLYVKQYEINATFQKTKSNIVKENTRM